MTFDPDGGDCGEPTQVTFDVYGVKVKAPIPAGDLGAPPPANWREVIERISGHLRRIVVAPTALAAEIVESPVRIVRGLFGATRFGYTAGRVKSAHAEVDRTEAEHEATAEGDTSFVPGVTELVEAGKAYSAVDRLAECLARQRAAGRDAWLSIEEGRIILVLGTPRAAREAIVNAARELIEESESDGTAPDQDSAVVGGATDL